MVQRANSGPDDASIMRCAVARRCIQLGYHKTADGMVHINAVELGPLGNDASFRCVRHKTRYRDGKLSTCLRLPDFAPYFEVVHMKDNLWVILQFHALVPSPSTTANALLSELSSVGTAVANGSSQSQLGRLPTPQPATTASASSSADVQCPDPAKVSTCGADSIPSTHPSCQAHMSLLVAFVHVDAACCPHAAMPVASS